MGEGKEVLGQKNNIEKHIGVLDGVRAMSLFFVCWFHLWQQNWITPYVNLDNRITKYFGIYSIPLDQFVRYGFVFVDLMVFLSAFCNFFPYVRHIILGEGKWPSAKSFYLKRAARILPSYYFAVTVSVIIEILKGSYENDKAFLIKDLLTHLTCTSVLFPSTISYGHINTVLWTVQMEVLFYILIPIIALLFKKKPMFSYMVLMIINIVSTHFFINSEVDKATFVNYPLTFLCMYANGFLVCVIYIVMKQHIVENIYTKLFSTMISISFFPFLTTIFRFFDNGEVLQINQLKVRLLLSFAFGVFIISLCMSFESFKLLFSNPLMRGFCIISYNLYIWHQWIFAKFKEWRIPSYEGDTPPNMLGDVNWSVKYTVIVLLVAFIIATLTTYLIEKPIHKAIILKSNNNKKNEGK